MQEGDRRSYGAYEKSFSLHDDLILRDMPDRLPAIAFAQRRGSHLLRTQSDTWGTKTWCDALAGSRLAGIYYRISPLRASASA